MFSFHSLCIAGGGVPPSSSPSLLPLPLPPIPPPPHPTGLSETDRLPFPHRLCCVAFIKSLNFSEPSFLILVACRSCGAGKHLLKNASIKQRSYFTHRLVGGLASFIHCMKTFLACSSWAWGVETSSLSPGQWCQDHNVFSTGPGSEWALSKVLSLSFSLLLSLTHTHHILDRLFFSFCREAAT